MAGIAASTFAILYIHKLLVEFNLLAIDKIYQSLSIVEDNFHDTLGSALSKF
jgi:hypothetical protein